MPGLIIWQSPHCPEVAAMKSSGRPTSAQMIAAAGKTLPDLIGPHLSILFCGSIRGLYSAAVGRHFARPGNRFWTTLHRSGITERVLLPTESALLLASGCGITDIVERSSTSAAELTAKSWRREGGAGCESETL